MKILMTIEMTVRYVSDSAVTLIDVTGKEFSLSPELFSEKPREGQTCWVTVSKSEPRLTEPKEILNEILGTNT